MKSKAATEKIEAKSSSDESLEKLNKSITNEELKKKKTTKPRTKKQNAVEDNVKEPKAAKKATVAKTAVKRKSENSKMASKKVYIPNIPSDHFEVDDVGCKFTKRFDLTKQKMYRVIIPNFEGRSFTAVYNCNYNCFEAYNCKDLVISIDVKNSCITDIGDYVFKFV